LAEELKTCSKCGKQKPGTLEFFYKHLKGINGLSAHCKECAYVMTKSWAAKNREKSNAIKAKWAKNNPDLDAKAKQNWSVNNRERVNAKNREWKKNNPEKVKSSKCRTQARRKALITATHEFYERIDIFVRDGWICQLCFEPVDPNLLDEADGRMTPGFPTIDHIMPLSKGGGDRPDNVQLAHRTCNTEKNARLLEEELAILMPFAS
jgi:5-methylcytosine-specific restriction endonuclease McrA